MTSKVTTVTSVNLERYIGKWYEIAAFPQWFEKHGDDGGYVTATYSSLPNGRISVVNTMRVGSRDGPEKVARGHAYVADKSTNAKLRVSFFWPFYGDYWVLKLDDSDQGQYKYSLVGSPDRKCLWILSREPKLDEPVLESLKAHASAQGFDVSKLKMTNQ